MVRFLPAARRGLALALLLAVILILIPTAGGALRTVCAEVEAGGSAGVIAFVIGFVLASLLGLPAGPAVLLVGASYGVARGFMIAFAAATLAAALTFGVGRYGLRGYVRRRFQSSSALVVLHGLEPRDVARLVFLLRLSPIMPFAALTYAASLSRVGFRSFMLASTLGKAPSVFVYTYAAAAARRALEPEASDDPLQRSLYWLGLGATVVATWSMANGAKRTLARLKPKDAPGVPLDQS